MWRVPVLVALNPAHTARQLETMSDAEVVADAMAVSAAPKEPLVSPMSLLLAPKWHFNPC
jgi:hypothetical protein